MLFNSYEFIFIFLPIVLFGFYLVRKTGQKTAIIAWLTISSFVFYGYWKVDFLLILILSIFCNYIVISLLMRQKENNFLKLFLCIIGISFNLILLGYFKYKGFFIENLNSLFSINIEIQNIILPLGISFFTFMQITLVVDAYQGKIYNFSLLNHAFFVTFFPHLIAGPILHHSEFMPQLETPPTRPWRDDLAVGACIFTIGLFKKVVIADSISVYADAGYGTIHAGHSLDPASAWITILSYAFQIYYDFSGYSDMAVGLARMFGLWLPINFLSPYKAVGFVDFWRRWHITLSRFFRDYLYVPLGGNRCSRLRQCVNLVTVMVLGGLWHGAAWKFVLWGMLHGMLVVLDHAWNFSPLSRAAIWRSTWIRGPMMMITFIAVSLIWVPFRAENMQDVGGMMAAAFPIHPATLCDSFAKFVDAQFSSVWRSVMAIFDMVFKLNLGAHLDTSLNRWFEAPEMWPTVLPPDYLAVTAQPVGVVLSIVAAVTFFLPNTSQLFARFDPMATGQALAMPLSIRQLNHRWAVIIAAMFVIAIFETSHLKPFLYFQF